MLHPRQEIEYPCSDGLPMSDSDPAYNAMVNTKHALRQWFRNDPKVYVAANLLIYYKIGHPEERVAPDVFVAKGADNRDHDTYKIWEEPVPPTVTFEFMSRSSRHLDPKVKVPLYRELGVSECYLFDPVGKWLKPERFKAFHRFGKAWR
ncbi:MAG: Uma2 family endonuclease, partial [Candidatus Xenobia bacterium]